MNDDHHAIVVGIDAYPGFGEDQSRSRDLRGPRNDAIDVYDWLVDPAGGALPAANARLIVRPPEAPRSFLDAEPAPGSIQRAFNELEALANENDRAGRGLRVGRRLYFYVSGHGCARRRNEGCLFTANATRTQLHHTFASGWLEWFYNAGYFDECVLWMDSCMLLDLSVTPQVCGYRTLNDPDTPNRQLFTAYSARYPGLSVEVRREDGTYRGAFTSALLDGLCGAAANAPDYEVTSQSLRDYLIQAMKRFMTEEQRALTQVSKEPDFGFCDPISFVRFAAPPRFDVRIRHAAALANRNFEILGGRPLQKLHAGVFDANPITVQLEKGLYALRAGGAEQGFEVLGGGHDVSVG